MSPLQVRRLVGQSDVETAVADDRPLTATQGDRIIALLEAMAADLRALRAMGASVVGGRR